MNIRRVDKSLGVVEVNENGRDKSYRLYAGQFTVSYRTDRRKANERYVRMNRTLDANGAKAAEIREILAR